MMDNYFTLVKTTIGTRKCGVAVMGIARASYVLEDVCVCVCVCVYVCVRACVCVLVCVHCAIP